MSASVIMFPRAHRDTLEVSPYSDFAGVLGWRVTHVRIGGQRLGIGDFIDVEEAKSFAYRTAFVLGRTRVTVLGGTAPSTLGDDDGGHRNG